MGVKGAMVRRSCSNCMHEVYCEQKGICCVEHKSIEEKITSLHMTYEEYEQFSHEWNRVRLVVRSKLRHAAV